MPLPSQTSSHRDASAGLTPSLYRRLCSAIQLDVGTPFVLDDWEDQVAVDVISGKREVHVRVPEENGKTTWLAADSLIHLSTTPSPRAVIAARNEKQAKILYNQALAMVEATPAFSRRFVIRDGTNEIRLKGRRGNVGLQVIPADALSAHGAINTRVTIDEMHALPGLELYRVLSRKLGKRTGAQLVAISTAGEQDSEYEQMWVEILDRSRLIEKRGPRVTRCEDDQYIAWCWALEKDDDRDDMDVVKLANPASWITPEKLQAKRALPGHDQKHWAQVVCNLPTRDPVARFLPEGDWDAARTDEQIAEGETVTYGVDWGWTDDATAIVPLQVGDGLVLGAPTIIEPPRDGTDLNPKDVLDIFAGLIERNPALSIIHDEGAYGGGKVMTGLLANAFPDVEIIPVTPTGAADAAGYFLEQLRDGNLKHTGDADLKRHLMNAVRVPVKDDPERFRIARPKASRHAPHQRPIREIDAAVAAILAVWGTVGLKAAPEPFVLIV